MRRSVVSISILVILLVSLGSNVYAAPTPGATSTSTSTTCIPSPDPFAVTSVSWGLPNSPLPTGPGDQNVPLTLNVLYTGQCTVTVSKFEMSLSQPFVGADGFSNVSTYLANIAPNTIVSQTYYLDVNRNATLSNYRIPLKIQYNTTVTISGSTTTVLYYDLSQSTDVDIALRGSVNLNFASSVGSLSGGTVTNLTISISNSGTGSATSILPVVTAPSQVSILNPLSTVSELAPNSTSSQVFRVFVPSTSAGSALSLTFSATYYDAYSTSRSTTQTLGFYVSSAESKTPFRLEGVQWGSPDASPQAGDQYVPLLVNLQYLGITPAASLQATLLLPPGLTDQNGLATATEYLPTITSDQAFQMTFYLKMARSISPGTHNLTLGIGWMTTVSSSLYQSVALSTPPIEPHKASFLVQGAQWGSSNLSPQPGDRNVPLVLNIQYLGTITVASLQATLNLPAGLTDQNGRSSISAYASNVSPNQAFQLTFNLNFGTTAAPGNYNLPLGLVWMTAYSTGLIENTTITPPIIGQPPVSSGLLLSLGQVNASVQAGTQSRVAFALTNVGGSSIYSPIFSLSVSSPLVVMSNSPSSSPSAVRPGQTETYSTVVTSGPSAIPGVYGGTLSVTFTDQSGTQHAQSFPVGFKLTGTIALIVQNQQITQTSTGLTVSGSLLNEGGASAYFAQITGSVKGSPRSNATAYYVGQVDPNTPTSFTITIPLSAPSSARTAVVMLGVEYKDSFGANQTFAITSPASLQSAQQLSGGRVSTATQTSSDGGLVTLVSLAVIAVIVIVGVAGAVMVRKRRAAMNPAKEQKEKRVI